MLRSAGKRNKGKEKFSFEKFKMLGERSIEEVNEFLEKNRDNLSKLLIRALEQVIKTKDLNARDPLTGMPALYCAVWEKRLDVVKLLVNNGADLNVKFNRTWTPLDLATFDYFYSYYPESENTEEAKSLRQIMDFLSEKARN